VKALSVIITKTPYYGYAFEIAPGAEPDDGKLHVLMISTGLAGALYGIITSFLGGNRVGTHRTGHSVKVMATEEIDLQLDGNLARTGTQFSFRVLPSELTVRS
jgi:diacylglycerol kinase family enzyme